MYWLVFPFCSMKMASRITTIATTMTTITQLIICFQESQRIKRERELASGERKRKWIEENKARVAKGLNPIYYKKCMYYYFLSYGITMMIVIIPLFFFLVLFMILTYPVQHK